MERVFKQVAEGEKNRLAGQLRNIWQVCFSDTRQGTEFVFENIFPQSRCYGCFSEGICCAALYLIDGFVPAEDGVLYKAHYLFGAGTLPEYRGLGIMSELIEYSLRESFKAGDKASVLLPASDGLYSYYGGLGYEPLWGTVIREFFIPKPEDDLKYASAPPKVFYKDVKGIGRMLEKVNGDVDTPVETMRFSCEAVENALGYNGVYGGFTAVGDDFSVVASAPSEGEILLYQVYAGEKQLEWVLNWLRKTFECEKVTARLPGKSEIPFGMIRVLDKELSFSRRLYIGLTKD